MGTNEKDIDLKVIHRKLVNIIYYLQPQDQIKFVSKNTDKILKILQIEI